MLPTYSPWGEVQGGTVIAEGIVSVSTASHGGILLSAERYQQMPGFFRTTWAGGRAYEEDCDWAMVAVVFPEYFTPSQLSAAVKTLRRQTDKDPRTDRFLAGCEASEIAKIFDDEHADHWAVACAGSAPKGMKGAYVALVHNTTNATRKGVMSDWPSKSLWTTAELDQQLTPIAEAS